METLKQTPQKILNSLSKIGLQPRMSATEVLEAYQNLRMEIGADAFDKIANEALFNLDQMIPGQQFNYTEYFKGENCKIFLVVAFKYIISHYDYEFANQTYLTIRRK